MSTTLDWSHDLLGPEEQELFRRLSVFSGGFSLQAAESLGVNTNGSSILDRVETLVEQSLVVFDPGVYGSRYGMLEPVRQYAREKLERSGEAADTQHAHTRLFLALAEQGASELWGTGQGEWLERLERENYNLRAAITQALEADEGETAARLCWALWLFWWVRGHHREGRRLAEAALEHDLPVSLRAKASLAAATMSYTLADYPAAGAYWEQALRSSQQANELLTQAYSWAGTGLVELERPDYAEAASRMERALELFEASEDDSLASLTRTWLGTTLMARGELEGAEKNFMQGLESARRRQDPLCTYLALYNLSQLALTREDLPSAARSLREGIELSGETGDRANLAHFLEALAVVCSSRDEAERAAVLLGSAEGSLQKVGAPGYNYYVPDPVLRECAVIGAKTALGEDSFERARKRGKDLSFGQTVEYALEIATPDEPTSG